MNFKEHIKADVKKTFLNIRDFAEKAVINNVEIEVVEDKDKAKYKDYESADLLLFISFEEYKKIPIMHRVPVVNQTLNYNGRPAIILKVDENMGVYELMLQFTGGGYR